MLYKKIGTVYEYKRLTNYSHQHQQNDDTSFIFS